MSLVPESDDDAARRRELAEQRTHEALRRLHDAQRIGRIGDWDWDIAADVVTWSPQVFEILGRDPELGPVNYDENAAFYEPAGAAVMAARLAEVVATGEPREYEMVARRADGTRVDVHAVAVAECDAAGTVVRLHGTIQDISVRKQLEARLLQSQKMEAVGRLAGGVAHDFNNMLGVILGYTEMLLKNGREDQRGRLEQIIKAARQASTLTRQLLAFSRKQVMAPRVVDLNDMLADLGEMLGRVVGEDIALTIVPGVHLGQVRVDPGQLEQVVMNVCMHARDAMPQGGVLRVETGNTEMDAAHAARHGDMKPGRYVRLAISDTGRGIDPEVLAHIFEPFFTSKEEDGKSTGLGLAMVYGIVKQAGGSVSVYSEVGQGTTFNVYLPRTDEPAAVEPESDSPTGTGQTVLLVEDEPSLREIARELLEEFGYHVLEAATPHDAIDISGRHPDPIHLLLTDVVMPGMNGQALATALVATRPDLRVLYMSGYTDDILAQRKVLRSGTHLLEKPFTAVALLGRVRATLAAPVPA